MFFEENFIDEVREKNDIVEVISTYVNLQKRGSNYTGLCPFHSEKTPSFSVSATKQIYRCFGCGKGGNVIKFIQEYENLSFPEAVEHLANKANIPLPEKKYNEESSKSKDLKTKLYEVYKIAATYYYHNLQDKSSESAKKYFLDRGISEKTITKFGLGYAGKRTGELYKYLKSLSYGDDILKESSLVKIEEKHIRDNFFNRVMFPILDINNKVIAFGARVLGDGIPKYLNSSETKIFEKSKHLYGLNFARHSKKNYLILCEGYMDVIALHQAGFDMAVAALGTAFNAGHAILIKRYVRNVYLTFDSDNAGINAARRAIPILKDAGINVKIISLSPYKDPDEFIKNLGSEEFEKRIKIAKNSFIWDIEVLSLDYDKNDPASQTEFQIEIAKKIAALSIALERDNYIESIARDFNIDKSNLKDLVNKVARGVSIQKEIEENREKRRKERSKDNPINISYAILISFLIENTQHIEKLKSYISLEDLEDGLYKEVLEYVYTSDKVDTAKILDIYRDDDEKINELTKMFTTDVALELSTYDKEIAITETVRKIKKFALDRKEKFALDIRELMDIANKRQELNSLKISLS